MGHINCIIWIIWYGPDLRWVLFWKINHPWLYEAVLNKLKIHQIRNQWLKCQHWNTREVILKQKNDLWSLRNQKSNDRWGLCLKTDFKLSRVDFDSRTSFILDGANIKQSRLWRVIWKPSWAKPKITLSTLNIWLREFCLFQDYKFDRMFFA